MQLNDGTTAKPLSLEYKENGVRKIKTDRGIAWYNKNAWALYKDPTTKKVTKPKTPKK